MRKIISMTLEYDDGTDKKITKFSTKWLLVVTGDNFNQISLSGDDINNAYLLRILENAVVQEMNEYNRYNKEKPKEKNGKRVNKDETRS